MSSAETVPAVRVGRFVWEHRLRAAEDVTGTRLLVLLALGTWMNADGSNGRPGHARLAGETGLSERTVRHHLAAAVESGWLVQVQRGHRVGERAVASCYEATTPTGGPVPVDLPSTGDASPVDPVDEQTSTGGHPPVVVDNAPDHRHPAATGTCGQPAPPAAPRASTGTQPPPTRPRPPREHPPADSTRGDHPAGKGKDQSKVDEVLAAWIEGQVAAIDATAGVQNPDGLRAHLADRALEEHLEVARRLVDRYPGESPGRLAAVLAGNNVVARALAATHRHLRVIDGSSS